MREILFKAKRKDNREWVEGYYCQLPKVSLGATITSGEMCSKNVGDYIIEIKSKQNSNFSNSFPFEVIESETHEIDPETLCQYTGIKDNDGNRIWENDILRQKTAEEFNKYSPFEWEKYGVVRFGEFERKIDVDTNSSIGFYIEHLKSVSINPKDYSIGKIQKDINQRDMINKCYPFEIIGNIFDNPELLERS